MSVHFRRRKGTNGRGVDDEALSIENDDGFQKTDIGEGVGVGCEGRELIARTTGETWDGI